LHTPFHRLIGGFSFFRHIKYTAVFAGLYDFPDIKYNCRMHRKTAEQLPTCALLPYQIRVHGVRAPEGGRRIAQLLF
jgi:hypothetical protein